MVSQYQNKILNPNLKKEVIFFEVYGSLGIVLFLAVRTK